MPFSKELRGWCKNHPEFQEALKVVRANRFVALGVVYTSSCPLYPGDQVIGFLVYDYKDCKFKQDFIVNIRGQNKEFIVYSRVPGGQPSKYVKDIHEFDSKYAQGKYYQGTHHIEFESLSDEIKPRAQQAMNLAKRVAENGLRELSQGELDAMKANIIRIKQENGS